MKDERGIEQVTGLSLDVRAGEIVGIAGVDGNGQKELVDAITCLVKVESGTISVQGTELQNTSPRYVLDHGVATVHSDRHRFGMVLPMTVAENMVLERHGEERFGKGLMLDYDKMRSFTRELIEEFDIRPSGCEDSVAKGLSGGNQQKAVIAREVSGSPELLVAVQPTRGLDVGAIEFVHKTLVRERDKGKAVLLISLELDEVMSVSDTIDVIYGGKIVGSFEQGSVGEEELGLLMAGGGSK